MKAGGKAVPGDVDPSRGRRAQGDGVDLAGHPFDHLAMVGEGRDFVRSLVAAGNGDEIEARVRGDRGHMLVPGDLAVTDDRDADGHVPAFPLWRRARLWESRHRC